MFKRTNGRQSRVNTGRRLASRFNVRRGRGRFTGAAINVNRFISKAVETSPANVFVPEYKFDDFAISEALKRSIARRGFSSPMPIQDKAIPSILSGNDVIGLANTGTGKTAAFLLPIINKILANPNEKALIIAPTRELAIQIEEEFFAFTKGMGIYAVVVVGGAPIGRQISQLRLKHNVIIGTPGRLKDLIARKVLDLSRFTNVVLDEADRMLDMGFLPDVKMLLSLVARERQTLLFSATLSPEIENLVRTFLKNPKLISIKTQETSKNIDQDIVRVGQSDRVEVLHDLLIKADFQKVLIFTRTKFGAEKLSINLMKRGFKSESIHGDKPQSKRQRALRMFKEDHIEILVATDVAARGLDIPDVSHVINFDLPATYEDYVHRIGRTGRADKKGTALTFVD